LHHNKRVFVRLLTAIPLLFWASTAAMAHLAVLWAAEPAAAITHTTPQDSALVVTSDGQVLAQAYPPHFHPPLSIGIASKSPEQIITAQPFQPEIDATQAGRILAASRLLANPPPFGV
jgi:hypothetical protein